jgi:hypothetical protein
MHLLIKHILLLLSSILCLADFKNSYYDHKSGMFKIGKHKAGRLFDGKTWSQLPEVQA